MRAPGPQAELQQLCGWWSWAGWPSSECSSIRQFWGSQTWHRGPYTVMPCCEAPLLLSICRLTLNMSRCSMLIPGLRICCLVPGAVSLGWLAPLLVAWSGGGAVLAQLGVVEVVPGAIGCHTLLASKSVGDHL